MLRKGSNRKMNLMDPKILSLPMRNANEKKEEEREMMLNWLESGEFSFYMLIIIFLYACPLEW